MEHTDQTGDVLHHPLPRLTRRVFKDLAIWMMGPGLLMGVAFPFFVMAFGVPAEYVLTPPLQPMGITQTDTHAPRSHSRRPACHQGSRRRPPLSSAGA